MEASFEWDKRLVPVIKLLGSQILTGFAGMPDCLLSYILDGHKDLEFVIILPGMQVAISKQADLNSKS